MKTLLFILFIFLQVIDSLAMIGMSYADMQKTLGQPDRFDKVKKIAQWDFDDRDFYLIAMYDSKGVCCLETYKSFLDDGDNSILDSQELYRAIAGQIPKVKFEQVSRDTDFGGITLVSNNGETSFMSGVTPFGRLAKVIIEPNIKTKSASKIIICRESFARSLSRD